MDWTGGQSWAIGPPVSASSFGHASLLDTRISTWYTDRTNYLDNSTQPALLKQVARQAVPG
jgi:hypothetical protein